MKRYVVFLGAPTAADLQEESHDERSSYTWKESIVPLRNRFQAGSDESQIGDILLPAATLEAATTRISEIYRNVIFPDEDSEHEDEVDAGLETELSQNMVSEMITWLPTNPETLNLDRSEGPAFDDKMVEISRLQTAAFETQEAETQNTNSYNISDGSSIALFPAFHIKMNNLISLSGLMALAKTGSGSRKIDCVAAVLESEGPDRITIKKGVDAGKEVAILKMVLGDETGGISKLTAWRETAENWGNDTGAARVKRGDIVSLESVLANFVPSKTPTLTASPKLSTKLQICYRTLPFTPEDLRLRPDLRLGEMDVGVRKVGALARWFRNLAGIP